MCSGQPTQSANPVRGLWPHSVAICCRALPSPAPFRVERSESQVVKSSSASSASYSHSASSANISTICLFMHSHCVAKANALRANSLWPLSSPETKPVRVGILTQPFPPHPPPSSLPLPFIGNFRRCRFVCATAARCSSSLSRLPATLLPFAALPFPSLPFVRLYNLSVIRTKLICMSFL